jgi:hypothetical protein
MKGYPRLVSFACALFIGGALPTSIALGGGIPEFQAGAGVLSYSFFNLSGQSCTLTPYGTQPNPYSHTGDSNWGWQNTGSSLAFFNNGNPEGNGGWIFYNNSNPIDTTSLPPQIILTNGTGTGNGSGTSRFIQGTSTETWTNWSINYPAMGDSWGVNCGIDPSAIATLASSGSSLQSGWYGSYVGSIPNANITPTGYSNPFNDGCSATNANPCGADFTDQGMNWNLESSNPLFQNMGALWTGINYDTVISPVPASLSLNFAILPINFSAYVQASTGINFTDMTPNVQTYYTPIYGGHTAIAVGDPYLVSSISAKILWFLATSSTPLNDDTSLPTIASVLSNTANTGVFWKGSYEEEYVQWFVGSQSSSANYPGQPLAAATAYHSAYQAASVPINQETVWGKVFEGLADLAIGVATTALAAIPGAGGIIAGGIATGAGGALMPDVNSAIANATQYSASGSPPNPTQAPVTFNGTFAATNLFGLLLSNMGVQSEINAVNNITGGPSPLWSNYDINADSECSGIGVTNNLMQGTCKDSNNEPVDNGSNSSLPEGYYKNVYAPVQTTTELSIWNAILSGSNITTNSSGYMVTGGSNQYPSFSPPIVVVNASSSNFTPNSILVNSSFNPNTGYLSATSIGLANQPYGQYSVPAAEPGNIPPQALQTNYTGTELLTWTISITEDGISYIAGSYTVSQYCITNANGTGNTTCTTPANGVQTINMAQCIPDSLVVVGDYIETMDQPTPTVGITLGCQPPPTPLTNVALDYSNCTNDQWASGGVYAAVTIPPNATDNAADRVGEVTLACACVPSYLDGPQAASAPQTNLLGPPPGGYVVGATSSAPGQQCPKPAT